MRRWAKCLLIVMLLTTQSGCMTHPELQNFAYATAIGLDYKNGQWHAYIQVLNFANIASTEKLEIGKPVYPWIGRGQGDSVTEALSNVGRSSQLKLFWGHVKAIILTEGAMTRGVNEIHKAINRYREVRYNVLMFGTKEKLEEVFSRNSLLNLSPLDSLLFTGMPVNSPESFIIPDKVNRIIANMNEPGEYARVASIGFRAKDWSEGTKPMELIAVNGVYYFHHDKMTAWISVQQLKGIRWMEERLSEIPAQIGPEGRNDAVMVFARPHMKIRPVMADGTVSFDLRVKAKAYVLELSQEAGMKQLQKEAEEMIEREIRHTFRQGVKLRCDTLDLQQELYRSDPARFRELTQTEDFFLTDQSLRQIHVRVHLTGMGKYKGRKS